MNVRSGQDFNLVRCFLKSDGYLGSLERVYLLVKLVISPPGPPYEASLAGLMKARRHPEYPDGLLFAHRNLSSARNTYMPSSWNGACLVVSPPIIHPEADDGDAFLDFSEEPLDMVSTMPTELVDKFVIAAARAYYRTASRSKRQTRVPKEDTLLFYRQVTCVKMPNA